MQTLLELQLKLPSGQNLWKEFLYLKEICSANFSFKFIFETYENENNFGAEVSLDSYDSKEKKFYFKKTCNKRFVEKIFSTAEILSVNMLYRPCLIKLNAQYHLREQQLPFFYYTCS